MTLNDFNNQESAKRFLNIISTLLQRGVISRLV
jgi:hypothetical protein